MLRIKLTREPAYYNQGIPCFSISQDKGLHENQSDVLTKNASGDGYTRVVGNDIYKSVKKEVSIISSGKKLDILELGGGTGSFFDCVSDYVSSYVNIDPSLFYEGENISSRLGDNRYGCIQCSAENIPLEDSSMDIILSIASLDHMPDVDRVCAEVLRVLKPGGYFIISINNKGSWWKRILSGTEYLHRREVLIAQEHYFQWSTEECEQYLSKFFYISKVYTITYFPFVPKIWKLFLPAAEIVGKQLLPRLGANMVCVARK